MLNVFNLTPLVNTPTRVTATSKTLLDNVFTDYTVINIDTRVLDPALSDHLAIMSSFRIPMKLSTTNSCRYTRIFSDSKINYFKLLLKDQKWEEINESYNVNNNFNEFYNVFKFYYNVALPLEPKKLRNAKMKPWLTPNIRSMSTLVRQMSARIKLSNDVTLHEQFVYLKNNTRSLIKKAKRENNDEYIKGVSNYSRAVWEIVKLNTKYSGEGL